MANVTRCVNPSNVSLEELSQILLMEYLDILGNMLIQLSHKELDEKASS